MALFKTSGADDDGFARGDASVELCLKRMRRGKIDQHVGRRDQCGQSSPLIDAACMGLPCRCDGFDKRLPHAPCAANDADCRHILVLP